MNYLFVFIGVNIFFENNEFNPANIKSKSFKKRKDFDYKMEVKESTVFIQNSYVLMVGYFLSTAISTIGTILIIRLISVEEYSFINIAYILPNIFINFSELGLNFASIHFIARKASKNDEKGIRNVIKINLYIKILIGSVLTLYIAFFPWYIAREIYQIRDNRMILLIQIASIGVLSTILYEALRSFFLGAQNMTMVQYGSILRSSLRTFISVFLIFIGFTLIGPLIGYVFSTLITVIFLFLSIKKIYPKGDGIKTPTDWKELSKMFRYGYPLMLLSFIVALQNDIYILILTVNGYVPEVSYLNVAITSAGLFGILKKAISDSLFPVFSKKKWEKEKEKKSIINYYLFSLKFEALLMLPVAVFIIIFSSDFFSMIFGEDYRIAAPFMSIYFLNYLFIPIGSISIPALFNGQKHTKIVLYIEIVNLISSVILSLILIDYLSGFGVVVGIVLGKLISILYGNLMIHKYYGTVLYNNFKNVFSILLMSLLSGLFTYIFYNIIIIFIPPNGLFITLLILISSFIIYIGLFLFLIGIFLLITYEEIDQMVRSFKIIPIFSKAFYLLAIIEKKVLKIRLK